MLLGNRSQTFACSLSKWQIIRIVTALLWLWRRIWLLWLRLIRWLLGRICLLTDPFNLVCPYLVKPTPVPFVSVNVERHRNLFVLSQIELFQPFLSEDCEGEVLDVLARNLKDVLFRLPTFSRLLRRARLEGHQRYKFACYLHISYLYSLMIYGILFMRLTCSLR